ncbi:hypothetical protein ACLEPN_27080 [Myxococcus sp. 1LA]
MMKLRGLVGAVAMVLMVGCGPTDASSVDEGEQVSPLTQEELEKLQASTPVPDAAMLEELQTACGTTPEGACVAAGYGACTGWSAVVDCGSPSACDIDDDTCRTRICNPERPSDCEFVNTGTIWQSRAQYRVCSNPQGATCTEYIRSARYTCRCAGGPF